MTKYLLSILMLLIPGEALALKIEAPTIKLSLDTQKVLRLKGQLTGESLPGYQSQLSATIFLKGQRVVLINSPGGSVAVGQKILDQLNLERLMGTKIICVVDGLAASMAFEILTTCDVRLATDRSILLFHAIRQHYEAVTLTASEARRLAKELDEADKPWRAANLKALGLTEEQYDFSAEHNLIWSADSLLDLGYLAAEATVTDDSPKVSP